MANVTRIELFQNDEDVERPEGVRTQWVSVTPDYAERVLNEYEKFCDEHPDEKMNRSVNQATVNKYAEDMRNQRWGRNHQGIAFDKRGVLMDGQHRLWAVVESMMTVMMPVTHGLDREAQLTIDVGLRRSSSAVAAIAGFQGVRELHIATLRAMLRGGAATRPTSTPMQDLEQLKEHWKAVTFAISMFPRAKISGITRASVMAALARAFYSQDEDKLRRFAEVLASGLTSAENEHVIITLRNWLTGATSGKTNGHDASSVETYAKTVRALQAYLKGESIRTLYASATDQFPLPVRRTP
mgnify:FL=1